jgi:hypothetical protein
MAHAGDAGAPDATEVSERRAVAADGEERLEQTAVAFERLFPRALRRDRRSAPRALPCCARGARLRQTRRAHRGVRRAGARSPQCVTRYYNTRRRAPNRDREPGPRRDRARAFAIAGQSSTSRARAPPPSVPSLLRGGVDRARAGSPSARASHRARRSERRPRRRVRDPIRSRRAAARARGARDPRFCRPGSPRTARSRTRSW